MLKLKDSSKDFTIVYETDDMTECTVYDYLFTKREKELVLNSNGGDVFILDSKDDMEEWDNVQVNKFITKCKSYADKHKDEFENRKDVPSNVSDTWPGTKIITEGGDDLTDIPSGKWEGDPVSDSQLNFLNTLITECIDAGKDSMASEAKSRVNSGELTKKEASELIDKLKTAKG